MQGKDEKRNFTCSPIINGLARLLEPTQMIWKGVAGLTGACPSDDVQEQCPNLVHVQSESHWCTQATLQALLALVFANVQKVCEAKGVDSATTYWIFVMDCYAVHISKEFIQWVHETYPCCLLLYIPAACTGWLQLLDLSFNGVFKGILRRLAGIWLANHVQWGAQKWNGSKTWNAPSQFFFSRLLANSKEWCLGLGFAREAVTGGIACSCGRTTPRARLGSPRHGLTIRAS